MSEENTKSEFNPLYEETFDNTHEIYTDMRQRCPVAHSEAFGGFWALFKYEDIIRLQEDVNSFSTAEQNIVPKVTRSGGRRPPLHFDPPEHAIYRDPINAVFKKTQMSRPEPDLREFADKLLDPLISRGTLDFTRDFAEYYAAQAFGLILNLPLERMLKVREVVVRYYRATTCMDQERMLEASNDLYAIAREVVIDRKNDLGNPETDLVSSLLLAKTQTGEAIPEQMVVASIRQILSAAQAAPGAMLGSIAVHLARDLELQETLRSDLTLMPAAIEEFLRMYSPYRVFARTATKDVEIRGRKIKAGEPITMIFPSGNRDEDIFERPHEFLLTRKPNRHIAFGRGPHQCPAAPIARLELRIAVEALLAKTSSFTLNGPVKMMDWVEFGPASSPLKVVKA